MKKALNKTPERTSQEALAELDNETVLTPDEVNEKTLAILDKHGLKGVEKIKIKNPITKKEVTVDLRRDGTPESDLIIALLDTKNTQEQKDFITSMYLWNRGSESASFILDIMRSKGEHTKETRVFKSQMRFDFEAFVDIFAEHLRAQALMVGQVSGMDIEKEGIKYRSWLQGYSGKGKTYIDFVEYDEDRSLNLEQQNRSVTIMKAIFDLDTANRLIDSRKNIAKAREREKGAGIYVSKEGKVYSWDDPAMDEIIKADREATQNIEQEGL